MSVDMIHARFVVLEVADVAATVVSYLRYRRYLPYGLPYRS